VVLPDNEVVSCLQMPGINFIKNLNIAINQREVYDSNQLYPFKCYLDTELSYPTSVKDSYLSVTGYFRDPTNQNDFASTSGGLFKRKNLFARSKNVQTMCRLNADIFNTNRFLINNCEVDIRITPVEDDFFIIQAPTVGNAVPKKYTYEIADLRLHVKTLNLHDGLSLDIAKQLEVQPARYGLRRTMLKHLLVSAGDTEFNANLYIEEVPRRLIIGLVENSAFIGNKNK
jgi:hypothetical protein